jgi:hypothetical protein
MAGKIAMVAELIKSNPGMEKKDLVALVVKEIGVPKQNAYVYIFNANKKLAKGDMPKVRNVKVKTKEVSATKMLKDVGIKAKNLETMKRVSQSQREEARLAKRAELQPVIDQLNDDADEYVKSLTAPTRKFLLGAE